MPFWKATSVRNFRTSNLCCFVERHFSCTVESVFLVNFFKKVTVVFLFYDVVSGSEITSRNKIEQIFGKRYDVHINFDYIMTK